MLHFDWSLSFLWEGSALSIYSIPRADLFRLQLHLTLVYLRLCTSSLAKGSASASITLSLFSLVAATVLLSGARRQRIPWIAEPPHILVAAVGSFLDCGLEGPPDSGRETSFPRDSDRTTRTIYLSSWDD